MILEINTNNLALAVIAAIAIVGYICDAAKSIARNSKNEKETSNKNTEK